MKRSFCILCFLCILSSHAQQLNAVIHLNQIGFYPHSKKTAVVTSAETGSTFYITSTNLRDTLFRGSLGQLVQSQHSSLQTRLADFSSFNLPGSYMVVVPGLGQSPVFRIGDGMLSEVGKASLKAFYFPAY